MRRSSDRSFGLTFALICAAAALWTLQDGWIRPLALVLAGTALALAALAAPRLLRWPNRAWHELGVLLGRITTPVVMGLVFLLVVTPIALIRRAGGHDPLRRRPAPPGGSYWLDRPRDTTRDLTRQF
jgi:Saxitoxin biosynthesis operon protein SxtJ